MPQPHAEESPWVDGLTIDRALARTVAAGGDRDALVFPDAGLMASYAEFDRLVDAAAHGLASLGIGRGEHLAVWATNRPEWVITQFAAARIGAVLVTVNPAYRSHELRYLLRQANARALILIDQFKGSNYVAMLQEVIPELAASWPGELASPEFAQLRHVIFLGAPAPRGMWTWTEMIGRGRAIPSSAIARRERELSASDVINIQYTSGTTGFPKGAMLTHRNLLMNAYFIGRCQELTAADRICIPVPFYHCFGCVLGTLGAVVAGAAMVVPAESFDPDKTLHAIEAYHCTALYGVPTMFIAELEHPSFADRDLSSLRTGIMAGSPCPIEVMRRVTEVMGARELTIAYGQTEASPVITQTRVDDPIELRSNTVGRPLPGVEVRIVDPLSRAPLPPGRPGELCARGHVVMRGYYQMPEATAAAIDPDGWLHTGDLAVELPGGYYRITGRIKDLIIRGGENIAPREIEEFLYTHPSVQDVQVVGVPDRKYGEEVGAWIRLRPGTTATEEEIRAFCRDRLAYFKVPRYVRFVSEFPMTVTGKIQKFRIREQMIADLGLAEAAGVETA